jgi:hypothetical protein
MLAWVGVGIGESERPAMAPLVLAGLVVAVALARAGTRLLRRDPRAVGAGRRIAVGSVAHATGLVVLGFALGGSDWSAPAAVFGVVSLGVGALLGLALRHHGPLFALPTGPADAGTPLPGWLSRLLARRSRSRDASRPVVV